MPIEHLAQHVEAIPLLAGWIQSQWGRLHPNETLQDFIDILSQRTTPGRIPETFVAVEEGEVVGMASLVRNDLSIRPELTPWLAAVYVAPSHRGRGFGSAVVRAVMEEARALGVTRLYLITPDRMSFYRRLGWQEVEWVSYRGEQDMVMIHDLDRTTIHGPAA